LKIAAPAPSKRVPGACIDTFFTQNDCDMGHISTADIERISRRPGEKRYNYFLKTVVDTEEVYGLCDADGWALLSDDSIGDVIPLFPDPVFAERFRVAAGWEKEYNTEALDLNELMLWLDDMQHDGLLVAVFPNESFESVVLEPVRLKTELLSIFEQEAE